MKLDLNKEHGDIPLKTLEVWRKTERNLEPFIFFDGNENFDSGAILSPQQARTFAAALLIAADEAEKP